MKFLLFALTLVAAASAQVAFCNTSIDELVIYQLSIPSSIHSGESISISVDAQLNSAIVQGAQIVASDVKLNGNPFPIAIPPEQLCGTIPGVDCPIQPQQFKFENQPITVPSLPIAGTIEAKIVGTNGDAAQSQLFCFHLTIAFSQSAGETDLFELTPATAHSSLTTKALADHARLLTLQARRAARLAL